MRKRLLLGIALLGMCNFKWYDKNDYEWGFQFKPWTCTRTRGHFGDHIAHGHGHRVVTRVSRRHAPAHIPTQQPQQENK
jgi:hypothetical protein